jgi:hypothetical protein
MGSEARFVPLSSISAAENGVIKLDAIKGKTQVGYVYGGIVADRPQASDPSAKHTKSSNALYEVWLDTSAAAPPGYWVSTTSAATGTATSGKISGTNLHPSNNVLSEAVSKPAGVTATPTSRATPTPAKQQRPMPKPKR